ncbi:hypothetical protein [Streptomyces sp. NPDC051546]|uniref:hypothetical protein n=1 Tax=Streptomyces sp. NPDC051546 TaxID=3365655 RepID=UPI00378FBE37
MKTGTPPPPRNTPKVPPFGWITDPFQLTGDEVAEFCAYAGAADLTAVDHVRLPGLVAVAYARRYDEEHYPWEIAGRIPLCDLRMGTGDEEHQGDEDEQEAAYAEACTEAALAGEDVPLPPRFGD